MKRFRWLLLLATSVVVLQLAAAENLNQCLLNCPPGNNSCTQCCFAQYDSASQPCANNCAAVAFPCLNAALQQCGGDSSSPCYQIKAVPCLQAENACQSQCEVTVQIAGGCPGEVPPQPCQFNCQIWNPASKSCIGPASNGCGQPQKCPYDCQIWNSASASCVGAPMNGCALRAARAKATAAKAAVLAKQATPPVKKKP